MSSVIKLRSGATEKDIAHAFKAANDGDTILFPQDETIVISEGLNLKLYSRSITIDLNGSILQQGGNNVVLAVWGEQGSEHRQQHHERGDHGARHQPVLGGDPAQRSASR